MLNKKCFVLDLDGIVYLGDIPARETTDFILRHWDIIDLHFLSGNASKAPTTYVNKLTRMGISTTLDHILSPVIPLITHLRGNNIRTVYPVGNHDFVACLRKRMPELNVLDYGASEGAEAVVLAYDTELTYEKLTHATLLLQNPEIAYLAMHPDLVCPPPRGPLPDAGSLMSLFETATGRRPQYIFDKPNPAVLGALLRSYGKKDMAMVGDRLSTNKKLAKDAGIDFVLIPSGETKLSDLPGLERQPTLAVDSLGQLESA